VAVEILEYPYPRLYHLINEVVLGPLSSPLHHPTAAAYSASRFTVACPTPCFWVALFETIPSMIKAGLLLGARLPLACLRPKKTCGVISLLYCGTVYSGALGPLLDDAACWTVCSHGTVWLGRLKYEGLKKTLPLPIAE
jgi:hypothetical protein